MAYMSQEKKARIAAELKQVMPRDWKYSLSVHHHSSIVLTIRSAPVDLLAAVNCPAATERRAHGVMTYWDVNDRHLEGQFSGEILETMRKINAALNLDNFDRSDISTDYFCVGHYVDINIGRWDRPFVCTAPKAAQAA